MTRSILVGLVSILFAATATADEASNSVPLSDPVAVHTVLKELYFDAARQGDDRVLGEYIDAHYDLNSRDGKGYTALMLAAYHGQAKAVDVLLKAGANPCAQDTRGNTALMGAIFKGEIAIARKLVGARCDPDQRNYAGQTAAMYAALFQRLQILEVLSANGADLKTSDAAGNTAASLLLQHGQDLRAKE